METYSTLHDKIGRRSSVSLDSRHMVAAWDIRRNITVTYDGEPIALYLPTGDTVLKAYVDRRYMVALNALLPADKAWQFDADLRQWHCGEVRYVQGMLLRADGVLSHGRVYCGAHVDIPQLEGA